MSPDRPTIWRTLRQRPAQPQSVAPAVTAQVARDRLAELLTELMPEQPVAFAAFLNGTPSLVSLDQLSTGDVQAMTDRLVEDAARCLALWEAR